MTAGTPSTREAPAGTSRAGRAALALLGVLALAVILRAPIAAIPLERDEGEYAYIAQRWLAGEVPYKQAFDQKPPGVFVAYAVILRALGESPAAIHWGAQVVTLGTLLLLFAAGRALATPAVGLSAAALLAFFSADHSMLGNAANTETFMLLPLVAAFVAALRASAAVETARGAARWSLAAGIASGLALTLKQVALPNLLFCLAYVAWRPRGRLARAALFLAGAAAALAPVLLYFRLAGAWSEFVDCVIGHNLRYASRLPVSAYTISLWNGLRPILAVAWPVALLAALPAIRRVLDPPPPEAPADPLWRSWRPAALWGLASFAGVATGGYFRPHYFLQAAPAVALLAGLGAASIPLPARARRLAAGPAARPAALLPIGLTSLALLHGVLVSAWYYGPGDPDAKARRLYGANPFPESRDAARFLAARARPGDEVFILGSEPQILFYARLRSASRYIFVYPLFTPFPDTPARQRAALQEVRARRPRFVVAAFIPTSFLRAPDSPAELIDGTRALLDAEYEVVAATAYVSDTETRLVSDEVVRATWKDHPIWYDTPVWASLAIWERRPAGRGDGTGSPETGDASG